MKALILGAHGLAGSAFMRVWSARGIECVAVTRENYDTLRGSSADIFVNANGNSSKFRARQDPDGEYGRSVRPVLNSLQDFSIGRYVLLSSADVYNNTEDPAANAESAAIDRDALSPYGAHKHLAEAALTENGRQALVLRLGGLIGPGLKKNPIYDIQHGDQLFVHPDSRFGYLHTDDLAEIALQLLSRPAAERIINVAGAGLVRIADVMAQLGRADMPVDASAIPVRYEINTQTLAQYVTVPESRRALERYLSGKHDAS